MQFLRNPLIELSRHVLYLLVQIPCVFLPAGFSVFSPRQLVETVNVSRKAFGHSKYDPIVNNVWDWQSRNPERIRHDVTCDSYLVKEKSQWETYLRQAKIIQPPLMSQRFLLSYIYSLLSSGINSAFSHFKGHVRKSSLKSLIKYFFISNY